MRSLLSGYFIVLVAFLFCEGSCFDVCANVTGCRCSDAGNGASRSLTASCKSVVDPQLHDLPFQNITQLSLQSITFSNVSMWKILRKFYFSKITLRYIALSVLDWNWLPETCNTVLYVNKWKSTQSPPTLMCNINPSLNITLLGFYYMQLYNIPVCIPSTVQVMQFIDAPLIDFQEKNSTGSQNNAGNIQWPANLVHFYMKKPNFDNIGKHVFRDAPKTLEKITIHTCIKRPLRFPSFWPPNSTIRRLVILHCHINETRCSDFDLLQKLESLNLQSNALTTLPKCLPKSLQVLRLSKNLLTKIPPQRWQGLINLTMIYMDYNLLRSVPLNLPKELIEINLRHNIIEYSDPQTFLHMTKLQKVDLSHNRLINMPEGLPKTMLSLTLYDNQISLIRSPASYEFCGNCTNGFTLTKNPWICNQNMIEMLLWANQNPVDLVMNGNCGDYIPKELGLEAIDDILLYVSYITDTSEYAMCQYTIQKLTCENASISNLPNNPPTGLNTIVMNDNINLTTIPDNHFISQTKLVKLELNRNSITYFPKGLPTSLEKLLLHSNLIKSISNDVQTTLNRLTNLKELDLSDNQITTLYDYQLKPLTSLYRFGLNGNPLHCDCSLYSLSMWFLTKKNLSPNACPFFFLPSCQTPDAYQGKIITQLQGAFTYEYKCAPLLCDWSIGVPTLNCTRQTQIEKTNNVFDNMPPFDSTKLPQIPHNTYWLHLDLSYLDLSENEIILNQLSELNTLNLTGNKLTLIPLKSLPQSIEFLILKKNKISNIPNELTLFLPTLRNLDLQYNQIKMIENSGITVFPNVESILLNGNPLICDCNLSPLVRYVQANMDNPYILKNHHFQNLTCFGPQNLKGTLLLDLEQDMYCQKAFWTAMTGGVIGGILSLLFISLVVIVILYKRRKIQERKDIVAGFRALLEKESYLNDEQGYIRINRNGENQYKYDAFVSYCNTDEAFVFKMLQELENVRKRKFCIHERDFTPGRGIADNIVDFIGVSRRVIIVISRKYLTSAWCQYEVQVALAQLHKHRQGKLLIPIILEDVTKDGNYDGSIQLILSLITGLHVPSPRDGVNRWKIFWNKFEEALPNNNAQN